MTEYHILFMKKSILKITNAKNNCIAKTKIINEVQCIKIDNNYVCVAIYLFKNAKNRILK